MAHKYLYALSPFVEPPQRTAPYVSGALLKASRLKDISGTLCRVIKYFFAGLFCILLLNLPAYGGRADTLEETLSKINGLKIRLIPTNPDYLEGMGVKTLEVSQAGQTRQVKWDSQVRVKTSEDPWPVYRITIKRGVLRTSNPDQALYFVHPALWAPGLYHLDQCGLLWVSPQIVEDLERKRATYTLEPGFLHSSFLYFGKGPDEVIKKVGEFRSLISQISTLIKEDQPKDKHTSKEKLGLLEFVEDFSRVRVLMARQWEPLIVNGQKERVPAFLLGNRYVTYTVLRISQNPLVLGMAFKPTEVPGPIRPLFENFQKHLEYQITQIQTGDDLGEPY